MEKLTARKNGIYVVVQNLRKDPEVYKTDRNWKPLNALSVGNAIYPSKLKGKLYQTDFKVSAGQSPLLAGKWETRWSSKMAFFNMPELHAAYEKQLAAIGKCDKFLVSVSRY